LRNQDFRNFRRDFDVETYHAQPRPLGPRPRFSEPRFEAPSGPPIRAVVKWFNSEKGFGFAELSDGSGDAFLHGSVLAQSSIHAVQPGDNLEVRVGPGHKGPHVTEVLSVDANTAPPVAAKRSGFRKATSDEPSPGTSVEITGTVKWFNAEKGFGFITRSSGGDDVFVHISALERCGLTGLSEGDRVIVDIAKGRKGLEVARIRLV
jgi:CspA family cold shock protein